MVIKFDFNKRDIVMMAAFLALMVLSGFLWLAGIVVGAIFHGILWGIILVTAAIVIGKKYTILILGLIYTIINVSLANMYGGALAGLNTFAGALVLRDIPFWSGFKNNICPYNNLYLRYGASFMGNNRFNSSPFNNIPYRRIFGL